MSADGILSQLTEGTVLEGPHWTEPVRVLTAKGRGTRIEVQAVGVLTKRLWTKLLKIEEFDGKIKLTLAGRLAALDGNPSHFRLAAESTGSAQQLRELRPTVSVPQLRLPERKPA